ISTTGEVVDGAPHTSTTEKSAPAPDPTQAPPPSPGPPGLPGLPALGPTATAAPVLDLTPEAVGKAVVQQVFPEVTRLASTAGNGTHRITLTLQPEQLGEVRVTLVVRDGSVHVRLAGGAGVDGVDGAAVHRALAGGAPELQRLLERTGAEARVSVRDPFAAALPTVTGPASSTAPQPVLPTASGQPGFQTGPDAQSRSDPQARHDGQSAREQPARDQPRQHQPRPSAYPVDHVPVPATGRLDRTV
ncbi:flagellar hook-length control protein FliK, partial [Nocardioides sp. Root79]|uniref:flagellar hook-length control protein FliK n=1 Tax=Nocardioides sp. Root79 TaxID=1736600 RepID=UPI00138EE6D8